MKQEPERQRGLDREIRITSLRASAAKSTIACQSETARVHGGRQAADAARRRSPRDLGLPIDEHGRVHYSNAQLDNAALKELLSKNW